MPARRRPEILLVALLSLVGAVLIWLANPALDSELDAMVATLYETNGVIVWVDYMRFRDYLPTVAFLVEHFPLEVVASLEGGTVLKLREDALDDRG